MKIRPPSPLTRPDAVLTDGAALFNVFNLASLVGGRQTGETGETEQTSAGLHCDSDVRGRARSLDREASLRGGDAMRRSYKPPSVGTAPGPPRSTATQWCSCEALPRLRRRLRRRLCTAQAPGVRSRGGGAGRAGDLRVRLNRRGLHERRLPSRNRQRLPVGPGTGCPKRPGRPWGAAGGTGPSGAGFAVISAAVPMACESEKSDATRWRTSHATGLARPMVPRIQICSHSPVYGQ